MQEGGEGVVFGVVSLQEDVSPSFYFEDIPSFVPSFVMILTVQRYFELIGELAATTDFHVADLQTLKLFLDNSGPPSPAFPCEALDRSCVTQLSLTLSQSVSFSAPSGGSPKPLHQNKTTRRLPNQKKGQASTCGFSCRRFFPPSSSVFENFISG